MSLTLIGQKIGMAQVFDKKGKVRVCTIIQADSNFVLQIKNKESDGYNSIQLCGISKKKPQKNTTKPLIGHYKKAGVDPHRVIRESRVEDVSTFAVGQKIDAKDQLVDLKISDNQEFLGYVDVEAVSKGKGYQGVMKLHNMAGMFASHGAGPTERHAGGTGMRSTPGRCFPNTPMASRMGGEWVTVQNLKLIAIQDNGILLVEGAVPGAPEGTVFIRKSIKRG